MTKTIAKAMAVALLITSVLGLASSAAAQSNPVHKMMGQVIPEYWYGYWPGNPDLCVLDRTDGAVPVAGAVAEFERTVVELEIRDVCGDTETIIVYADYDTEDRWPATTRPADAGNWDDDLWVMYGVVWIMVDPSKDLTDGEWHIALTHELGHAIGLDHTSRMDSLMHEKPYHLDGLTETDVAVLAELYDSADASTIR